MTTTDLQKHVTNPDEFKSAYASMSTAQKLAFWLATKPTPATARLRRMTINQLRNQLSRELGQ